MAYIKASKWISIKRSQVSRDFEKLKGYRLLHLNKYLMKDMLKIMIFQSNISCVFLEFFVFVSKTCFYDNSACDLDLYEK